MLDFLIRRKWSEREIKRALAKATEFRRNRYTSGSAHLDDLVALHKAIVLCDEHARKFKPRAAHYEPHPAPNLRRVNGNCDICNVFGLSSLFLHESLALDERRKWERYRIALEYGNLFRG